MKPRTVKFTPLTPKQRGYLAQLAKQAHAKLTDAGAIEETFDSWRKREAMEASSGFTISEAPRHCFDDLEQHFLMLAGKSGKALERAIGPNNDMRNLEHEISVAARAAGVQASYIQGICKRMFDGATTWSTDKQARAVLIALKKRARNKQQEEAA